MLEPRPKILEIEAQFKGIVVKGPMFTEDTREIDPYSGSVGFSDDSSPKHSDR